MREVTCPKCNFKQDSGDECPRCGIVFAKYKAYLDRLLVEDEGADDRPTVTKNRGLFWRLFRIFRWAWIGLSLFILILILRPAAAPALEVDPAAEKSLGKKFVRFQKTYQSGGVADLALNEAEINAWLDTNLVVPEPKTGPSMAQQVTLTARGNPASSSDLEMAAVSEEQLKSSIREVRVDLREQTLEVYIRFELYGKELSFQLEGYPRIEDRYLRLEPRSGWLGSFPIPKTTLRAAADRIFDSPENREKFRVPGHIRQIGVVDGQLSVLAF